MASEAIELNEKKNWNTGGNYSSFTTDETACAISFYRLDHTLAVDMTSLSSAMFDPTSVISTTSEPSSYALMCLVFAE